MTENELCRRKRNKSRSGKYLFPSGARRANGALPTEKASGFGSSNGYKPTSMAACLETELKVFWVQHKSKCHVITWRCFKIATHKTKSLQAALKSENSTRTAKLRHVLHSIRTYYCKLLVQRGVVHSLDVLTSYETLSPLLKAGIERLLIRLNAGVPTQLPAIHLHHSMPPLGLENVSCVETPTHSLVRPINKRGDSSIPVSDESVIVSSEGHVDDIESLVRTLADAFGKSSATGLHVLEAILSSIINADDQALASGSVSPEFLCSRITHQFESIGYRLFASLDSNANVPCSDSIAGSPTAFIIRTFIFSQHERIQGLLLFWSKNGLPVGAHLLYYASRLAYEAYMSGYLEEAIVANNFSEGSDSGTPLMLFHVDGFFSIVNGREEDSHVPNSRMDKELVSKLVENVFAAYRCFLLCSRVILHEEDDASLAKLLLSDVISCFVFEREKVKFLFCSIFFYLADLCTGEGDLIKLFLSRLDYADLVDVQFSIGLKKFCVCGENIEAILRLIKNSLSWDSSEQHKFWALVRSELAISKVQVEKIILEFFCSGGLDGNITAIAVGGLLTLCSCRAPTPELVGAIMLLPNHVFQQFSATALSSWAVSNASMLFDSLTTVSKKLDNKTGDTVSSAGISINHSAILWLLNYCNAQGMTPPMF